MSVSNFPPNTERRIQPRNWTLDGNQPGGPSTTVGDLSDIYTSDLVTIINRYNNGIGPSVVQGQDIGFVIEKVAASAPASDPSLYDTRFNLEVTDVLSTEYEFTETEFLNIYLNPPGSVFKLPKSGGSAATLNFNGARNFADTYINGNPAELDPSKFGSYRLVSYARDSGGTDFQTLTTDTFEFRGLAVTNLKSTPERIEVDGVIREVTITGDITVYPNPTDNGVPAWTPPNDINWRVTIKHKSVPENQWVVFESGVNGVLPITPTAPNSEGVVGSFSVTWDGLFTTNDGPPYSEAEAPFVEMVIEARAVTEVSSPTRTIITPLAVKGVWCKKCQSKATNPFAELSETISLFDSALSDLSTAFNYSSSESSNDTGSMGFGWFSTENIKIVRPLGDDTDLVYCDEMGMCRRWVLDSGSYVPVLPDNRMKLSVNLGSTDARYTVVGRDGSRREFDSGGSLKKMVDSNGHETVYSRQSSYLAISDGKGRTVYNHFTSGEPQPRVINDNVDPDLGRRYVLDYTMDGSTQKQLKSITDPVGDSVLFVYGTDGRIAERRAIYQDHTRSVFYTYDDSGTGRLASMKASSTLLQADPDPDIVTDHYMVEYSYNVPFTFDSDGASGPESPVDYITTKIVTTDLEDSSNPERVSYLAYDSLSRVVGTFEEVLDDTDSDNEIDDLTYIATLHEYNDSNDPWLRTKTIQINKGTETTYEYTARGNLERVVDAQLNETVLTYVEEVPGHPASATFPDLVTEVRRPAPDLDNNPTVFYPTTKFTYDPANANLLSVEDAQGETTDFRYNSDGQINRIINRRGFKTYMVYDSRARLEEVHVQTSLAPTPLISELVNENANDFRSLTLSYNNYDNLTGVLDANGDTIEISYDDVDRPTVVTDGNDIDTVFDYLNGVLDQVTLPENNVPDPMNPNVRLSKVEYDSAGRPLRVKREDSNHSAQLRAGFTYDGFSQLRSLIRLKHEGLVTEAERSHTAEYDRQGRTIRTVDANDKESTAAYEPYCVGFATTSARGVRRRASFDTLCRLTQFEVGTPDANPLEVASASETRTFLYDDLGRLIKSQQSTSTPSVYGQARFGQSKYGSSGGTPEERSYEYDSLDRLTRLVFEDGKEMSCLYDEEGNVTQVTENASSSTPKVTQFSYYGDNRLYQVTYVRSGGDQTFTYAYDPGGRPLTLTYPDSTGIVAHFSGPASEPGWDGKGQLKHLRYVRNGTDTLRRFEFEYDDAGNRISQLDVVDIASPSTQRAVRWEYGYDWLDRLETVKKAEAATVGALGALQLVSIYTYDAADNRIEFKVPDLSDPALDVTYTYSYKYGDEIESISKAIGTGSPAVIETFMSDDDGNLKTRTSGGVTTTYGWTDFNRLASITTTDNSKKQTNTFGLNGFRRKKKDKNDVETTEYAAGLATAVSKAQGGDTFTYLMGHRLMGFERESDGEMFYFLTDALSTVRDLVDSGGAVKASYEFSEYGARIASSESGVSSQKAFVGGMSVQDEVAETGLMMMGHRFYDSSGAAGGIGRFLNRDPIGFSGGLNLFKYANNNPVTQVDPMGLDPLSDVYGINSEQQAKVFGAGAVFLVVVGTVLTIGVPEPSDLAISATVAGAAKATRGLVQVGKAGARYWKLGKAAIEEERVAEHLAERGFEVFLASDNKLFQKSGCGGGIPDIRINGTWWDIKTPRLDTDIYNGVANSLKNAKNQELVSRVIVDFGGREGATFHEVHENLIRVFRGDLTLQTKIREVMVIIPHGEPIRIPTWKLR